VGIGERVQKLHRHPLYDLLIEASAAAATTEEVPEIPARDTFDNDEGHVAILEDVVYLHDVLVIQGCHGAGLLPETPPERGHLGVMVMEGLQRDGTTEDIVFGPVDDRHPTGTERALYPVTSCKDRSNRRFQPLTTFDRTGTLECNKYICPTTLQVHYQGVTMTLPNMLKRVKRAGHI
jgi:hypothetical protein